MENPWLQLNDQASFVLPRDAGAVEKLLSKGKKIHTELPPEPYSGNKDAPLVLLWKRPSFNPRDREYMLENEEFSEAMRKTRNHEEQEYPFYHLDNTYPKNPGFILWSHLLEEVIRAKGYKSCADSILLLQYFPYKSNESIDMVVYSQAYSVHLLKEAMGRKASIVVMSGKNNWKKIVRGLEQYENIFYCKNVRDPTISKGNVDRFDEILGLFP